MIYLDNCATTRPRKEVIDTIKYASQNLYANPSGLHSFSMEVEDKIDQARESLAKSLGVPSSNIFFTSGATEGSNIYHHGLLSKDNNRKTIITSNQEHPATEKLLKYYENLGYKLIYLKNHLDGRIDLDDLEMAIDDSTLLVSIIHVNNQLGAINDLESISQIVKSKNSKTQVYIDGVQSYGKIKLDLKDLDIDAYTLSAHKIHGPKGVGALYIKNPEILNPIFLGGAQESGIRPGTENVSGILGLEKALEIKFEKLEEESSHIKALRDYMLGLIGEKIPSYHLNTNLDKSIESIVNISFIGVKGEVLVHFLEEDDIYISTTSACSSNHKTQTNLEKLGVSEQISDSSVRICLSFDITKEDIDTFVDKLDEAIRQIRKVSKK